MRLRNLALGLLLMSPFAARAEEEPGEAATACTATTTEEACRTYWEHHVNWWSWDYKAGPAQLPEHRHMPPPFGFALINFGVFFAILYRLAAKPLKDFVRSRHLAIRTNLDEARALREQAEEKLHAYEGRLAGLEQEMATLLEQARREAETEKAEILRAAQKQAARLSAEADAQVRRELEQARQALGAEAIGAALDTATELLRTKLGPDDQRRLVEQYLGELDVNPAQVAHS